MKKFIERLFAKKDAGSRGEDIATKFLKKEGYGIMERNYKNSKGYCLGEIDIIARDGKEIVFVEVKTRVNHLDSDVLPPEMNITSAKLHKLDRIAQSYLRDKKLENKAYRFDAVSIVMNTEDGTTSVKHIKSMYL